MHIIEFILDNPGLIWLNAISEKCLLNYFLEHFNFELYKLNIAPTSRNILVALY